MYDCQDMEKSIWDLVWDVIYTSLYLNLSPPLSVIACVWRACGGPVGLPLWYIQTSFYPLTICQVNDGFFPCTKQTLFFLLQPNHSIYDMICLGKSFFFSLLYTSVIFDNFYFLFSNYNTISPKYKAKTPNFLKIIRI